MQSPGRQFKSSDLQYKADDKGVEFSLDVAGAYPPEAAVEQWVRTIDFQRQGSIKVAEQYKLKEVNGEDGLIFHDPLST